MKIINTYIEYINSKKQLKIEEYSKLDYNKISYGKLYIVI